MRVTLVLFAFVTVAVAAPVEAQEQPVPKNEVRVQIPGCAYDRTFISGTAPAGEPVGAIAAGRRFKMSGSKPLLERLARQAPSMVEITGRIRRADLNDDRGIPLGGGVRLGGGRSQAPIGGGGGRDPGYREVMIDVESFRLLPDTCPAR